MKTKASHAELEYLFKKVIEKFNDGREKKLTDNTNKRNYEPLVAILNGISSKFKETAAEFKHDDYSTIDKTNLQFSAGQFMSAKNHFTQKPDQVIVDASYIYLFKTGQRGFLESPADTALALILKSAKDEITPTRAKHKHPLAKFKPISYALGIVVVVLGSFLIYACIELSTVGSAAKLSREHFAKEKLEWETIKKDFSILRYQPSKAEIDSLVGVWFCYTGSPQARTTLPNRYHMGARNVVVIGYQNGYFNFKRYSTNFDQTGYIQYESPGLISIHSHKINDPDSTLWPRHSLMFVNNGKPYHIAVSASWNFDTPPNDFMIGIREVYVKLGTGGKVTEVFNQGNPVKTVEWITDPHKRVVFNVKLMRIEDMNVPFTDLLNEKSILLAVPQENVLATKLIH
jgi:hypothetical protein